MAGTNIKMIKGEQFHEMITSQKADALVIFMTSWSGTTQILMPLLEELASQYHPSVQFYQIDQETENVLSDLYNVTTLPTLLFFKQGSLSDKIEGIAHKSEVIKRLNSLTHQPNN